MPDTQVVWRTLSETSSGWFVWEVCEISDDYSLTAKRLGTECLDGSKVLVQCFHAFTRQKAQMYLDDCWEDQKIVII